MSKNLKSEDFLRVKTFMHAMSWFNLSPEDKEKYLKDKRLSLAEKKILEASLLLRKGEFSEVIDSISGLSAPNILIMAMKDFVMGVAFNAQAMHDQGIQSLSRAIEVFHKQELIHWEFQGLVQIFYCYLNLKKKNELALVMDQMQEIDQLDEIDRISFLRCRFNYLVFIADYKKAVTVLKQIEKMKDKIHPGQYVNFLVDRFIYHLKIDQFQKCEEDLKELQQFRDHRLTQSFYFMQSLLAHYMHQKPIYLYDEQFKHLPLLFHQLKVIQGLESGDEKSAKTHWSELSQMNPDVYRNFMDYQGDKCLFSLCLGIYQTNESFDLSHILKMNLGPQEKKLISLLAKSGRPISKEELFFKIWGEKLHDKSDLSRLMTMVSRLKSKTGIEIKSIKGSYSLVNTALKRKQSC